MASCEGNGTHWFKYIIIKNADNLIQPAPTPASVAVTFPQKTCGLIVRSFSWDSLVLIGISQFYQLGRGF